jgi:hypothetical protein
MLVRRGEGQLCVPYADRGVSFVCVEIPHPGSRFSYAHKKGKSLLRKRNTRTKVGTI